MAHTLSLHLLPLRHRSYDFNNGVNYDEIMKSYLHMGYQGTNLGEAIEEIKRMVRASRAVASIALVLHAHRHLLCSLL